MNDRPTELACEAAIIDGAIALGWRVHGERAARRKPDADGKQAWETPIKGHAGWPDLLFVRGERMVVTELKRKPRKPTDDQEAWLAALAAVKTIHVGVLWVPEEQDWFLNELLR